MTPSTDDSAARRSSTGRLAKVAAAWWWFPAQCLLLAAGFWAYHRVLRSWLAQTGGPLGALRPRHLVPLLATPELSLTPWLLLAVVVVGAVVLAAPPVLAQMRTGPLLAAACLWFVVIGLSVAMIDGYRPTRDGTLVPAFMHPYSDEVFEYYNDVPLVEEKGPVNVLRKWAHWEFRDKLRIRSQTHPPGPALFLWAVSRVAGHNLLAASLATVLVGALGVVAVFLVGREAYGEAAGRHAVVLYLLMPNVVLYSTTCMDAVSSLPIMFSAWAFLRALRGPWWWGAVFGLLIFGGAMMNFGTIFIPLVAGVFTLGLALLDRSRFPAAARTMALGGLTVLAAFAVLHLATGYDPVRAVRASYRYDEDLMGTGYENLALFARQSIAQIVAWLWAIGIPLTLLWAKVVLASVRRPAPSGLWTAAYAVSLLALGFSTLYSFETERSWLFMAPFVATAAGHRLLSPAGPSVRLVTALMGLQVLVFEITLRTAW